MQSTTRRALLRILVRLPIVAAIAEYGLFGLGQHLDREVDDRFDKRLQAVNILRLINTVQLWHFHEFGHYADLGELRTSEAMERWLNDERSEKRGMGRPLYSTLDFEGTEISPGWRFEFRLRDDRRGYVVTLDDYLGKGFGAFSTDQRGVIHEGELLADIDRSENWDSAALVSYGKPIEVHKPHGLATRFKTFLLGPITALAGCCIKFPCACSCSCQGSSQPLCFDCGCQCCVWCCCPY